MLTTDTELARRVRVALAEVNMPVSAFARVAGLSRQHVSNVIHARTTVGELARIKVERALDQLSRARSEMSA